MSCSCAGRPTWAPARQAALAATQVTAQWPQWHSRILSVIRTDRCWPLLYQCRHTA